MTKTVISVDIQGKPHRRDAIETAIKGTQDLCMERWDWGIVGTTIKQNRRTVEAYTRTNSV